MRLRRTLIHAAHVLPSTPPLFQNVERHFLLGQFGGPLVSGIQRCPQTSHTATSIVFQVIADQHAWPGGELVVSVSVKPRK